MIVEVTQQICFEVEYTDDLIAQMRGRHDRPFDPYGRLAIFTDTEEIAGPNTGYIVDYVGAVLEQLLRSVPQVLEGERSIQRTPDENLYFVFEPRTGDALAVSLCYSEESAESPEHRLAIEQPTVVQLDSFAEAVIETSMTFIERLTRVNPDLESHPAVESLSDDIDAARDALEGHETDRSSNR